MDPDVTLDEIRTLATELVEYEKYDDQRISDFLARVTALDSWLSAGGFLPTAWRINQRVGNR